MKKYFSDIRNVLHSFLGLVLGYDITMLFGFPNREKFPLSWDDLRTLLAPVVGAVIVGVASFLWEKRQDKIIKNISDMKDVLNGAVFAFVGGTIALFTPSLLIAFVLSGIALVLFFKNYKK